MVIYLDRPASRNIRGSGLATKNKISFMMKDKNQADTHNKDLPGVDIQSHNQDDPHIEKRNS